MQFRFGHYAGALAAAIVAAVIAFVAVQGAFQNRLAVQTAQSAFGRVKLNILILGYQDDEATTDTIILAHLDVNRRMATLVSIPRDTWVQLPGHDANKINAAYAYGGAPTSAKAVARLMGGIPIDATVALQPDGAAQIVDAMGGLRVDVRDDMDYDDNNGDLHIHLKKGEQRLDGSQVVGYIRFRHDAESDFGRVRRQQQVLKLMMDQLWQAQNWAKLPRILKVARKTVTTTLSDQRLMALLAIYRNVPAENVRTFTLPSKAGWVGDASVVFVDERWSKLIGRLLFSRSEPPQDAVLVANATGSPELDATIVGALRGGGWNVPSSVDQARRHNSITIGSSPAARLLSRAFATAIRPGGADTLVIGSDLAPDIK